MKKVSLAILLFMFTLASVSAGGASDSEQGTQNSGSHSAPQQPVQGTDARTKEAIQAKWDQYKPETVTAAFLETPSAASPYRAGALTPEFLQHGINAFKFARYLAGLSENVVLDDELNNAAQHGAVLLVKNYRIDNLPPKPEDMDEAFYNTARRGTMYSTIFQGLAFPMASSPLGGSVFRLINQGGTAGYMYSRRTLLSLGGIGRIGIGYAEATNRTTAMITYLINDESCIDTNSTDLDMDYVAWPNKGYFPDNFFSTLDVWTVALNPRKYDRDKCNPTVKLTCLNNGQQWDFIEKDVRIGINFTFTFDGNCIIFKPAFSGSGISEFNTAKNYKIEISGLTDTSGKARQIVYEVEFFTLVE